MALPLDIRDMMSSSAKYRAEREKPIRIAVLVDAEAPAVAVDALKAALLPQTGLAFLHVEALVPGDVVEIESSADVVIGLAGPGPTLEHSLRLSRDRAIPTVLVGLEDDRDALARRLSHPLLDTVVDGDADKMVEGLGAWLGEKVQGKRMALAANFAFVRRAVADESVKSTAFQNAVIGGVAIIPGADMPLMTANQAKMVMQIAAAYGEPLGAERIKELASVVGGAFVLRAAARQIMAFVPGFGWAVKAGIGYSGTLAMGYAAIEYFENGGDVRGLAAKVREARDAAVARVGRRRGRGDTSEVIPATWSEVEDSPDTLEPPVPLPAAGVVPTESTAPDGGTTGATGR